MFDLGSYLFILCTFQTFLQFKTLSLDRKALLYECVDALSTVNIDEAVWCIIGPVPESSRLDPLHVGCQQAFAVRLCRPSRRRPLPVVQVP